MNQPLLPPREQANRDQLAASDPAVSAFVGASAGSGKTKLLTDRLLRLMLAGAKPERIQCLTFTKAAAAEMSVRLQKTLGQWVTLDDVALARELRTLDVEPTEPTLRAALGTLAGLASAEQFGRHVATLQTNLPRLHDALELGEQLEAAQRRALG